MFPTSSGCSGPALPLLGHALGLTLPRARLSVSQLQSSRPPALPRRGGPVGSFGSVGSGPRALSAGCWAVPELPRLCGRGRPGHWGAALASLPAPGSLPACWEPRPCPVDAPGGPHPAANTSCRLNSTEYGELCEKLRAPIRSAANVVIHQSLGDLFLETFASLVEVNPAYSVPSSQVGGWAGVAGSPAGPPWTTSPAVGAPQGGLVGLPLTAWAACRTWRRASAACRPGPA